MKVPTPSNGRPLFMNPATSDGALWAGVVLGGLSTFGRIREYFDETKPGLSYFTAADFGALLIDAGLGFGISFLMFGVLPAAIRRRGRRRQNPFLPPPPPSTKPNWSLVIIPLTAVALAIVAAGVDAVGRFPDTTTADALREAREAVNELSEEQRAAFLRLKEMPVEWNEQSQLWVNLYMDPNLGLAEFGNRAQPIVDNLDGLVARSRLDLEILRETDAEQIYRLLVQHYSEKLQAVKGMTTAASIGDAAGEQLYGQLLTELNSKSQAVRCQMIEMWVNSRYAGGIDSAELGRAQEFLKECK